MSNNLLLESSSVAEHLKGKIITFEAIDKVGKTTQSGLLLKYFEKNNILNKIKYYTFPDYMSLTGRQIWDYLHSDQQYRENITFFTCSGKEYNYKQYFEILQVNNKMDKLAKMRQELDDGYTLIMNRYVESQYVYGSLEGHDLSWLMKLNEQLPKSDIVFVLDLDMHIIKERIENRAKKYNNQTTTTAVDNYESDYSFLEKAKQKYLELAQEFDNWIVIDCNHKGMKKIHQEIVSKLNLVLPAITI